MSSLQKRYELYLVIIIVQCMSEKMEYNIIKIWQNIKYTIINLFVITYKYYEYK